MSHMSNLRSAVAQQIKALATPGPSSAVFLAAYLVSEAQGVALASIWKLPVEETYFKNVKTVMNMSISQPARPYSSHPGSILELSTCRKESRTCGEFGTHTQTHIVNFNP